GGAGPAVEERQSVGQERCGEGGKTRAVDDGGTVVAIVTRGEVEPERDSQAAVERRQGAVGGGGRAAGDLGEAMAGGGGARGAGRAGVGGSTAGVWSGSGGDAGAGSRQASGGRRWWRTKARGWRGSELPGSAMGWRPAAARAARRAVRGRARRGRTTAPWVGR